MVGYREKLGYKKSLILKTMLNTEQHNFIVNNRFEMTIMEMRRELGIGLNKLRNYMKDENLLVSKEATLNIRAQNRIKKRKDLKNINMSYKRELKMKLREAKTKLEAANHEIKAKMKRRECIDDVVRTRNNLTVDVQAIQSRIDNVGKEIYLATVYHIGE